MSFNAERFERLHDGLRLVAGRVGLSIRPTYQVAPGNGPQIIHFGHVALEYVPTRKHVVKVKCSDTVLAQHPITETRELIAAGIRAYTETAIEAGLDQFGVRNAGS